jgi:GTP-binding protein Era
VAVVGRPNVGKSTLVNRLVGEKVCIVSPAPQTTRNRIRGICNLPGAQVVLLDTPGIHRPRHRMNTRMVEEAMEATGQADLIYALVEPPQLGPGDRFLLRSLKKDGPPVFLLINKADTVRRPTLLPLLEKISAEFAFAEIIPLSARTGENVDRLVELTVPRLPEGPALFPRDQMTDQHERFLAGEFVREKICRLTREEVPHETAVTVDLWQEEESHLRLEVSIFVEKESQKGILIGREGGLLKKIGSQARADIEGLLGCHVFIQLWVKVRKGWRDDPRVLERIGLG